MKLLRSFALTVFCLAIGYGQLPTAQVTGLITDSSGAAVPSAQVELLNLSTGLRSTTTTNSDGNYVFPVVQPATWNLGVNEDGKYGLYWMQATGVDLAVVNDERSKEHYHDIQVPVRLKRKERAIDDQQCLIIFFIKCGRSQSPVS